MGQIPGTRTHGPRAPRMQAEGPWSLGPEARTGAWTQTIYFPVQHPQGLLPSSHVRPAHGLTDHREVPQFLDLNYNLLD